MRLMQVPVTGQSSNWPHRIAVSFEADVLGVERTTSRASQIRPVTRLSGNFSIAKAQRAVQDVFEVKISSIRCIGRYCSGFADRESIEGRIPCQGCRSVQSAYRVRVMDQMG